MSGRIPLQPLAQAIDKLSRARFSVALHAPAEHKNGAWVLVWWKKGAGWQAAHPDPKSLGALATGWIKARASGTGDELRYAARWQPPRR